jgi:hypothetical protein
VNEWWFPAAFGGLIFVGGFVAARYPTQTQAYLDLRSIPVHGFPRTVGGIRAMGVMFAAVGGVLVVVGFLTLFGVFANQS